MDSKVLYRKNSNCYKALSGSNLELYKWKSDDVYENIKLNDHPFSTRDKTLLEDSTKRFSEVSSIIRSASGKK